MDRWKFLSLGVMRFQMEFGSDNHHKVWISAVFCVRSDRTLPMDDPYGFSYDGSL